MARSFDLKKSASASEYWKWEFPTTTSLDQAKTKTLGEITEATCTIVLADSNLYVVEIKVDKEVFLSTHNYSGDQLGMAQIFKEDQGTGDYFFVTLRNIRVSTEEQLRHFQIEPEGRIEEVTTPKSVIDYFCILPDNYLYQYFNGSIQLFPDLLDGYYWHHTYVSKFFNSLVDIKNGYIDLITKMALFRTDKAPYFILNNSAGGTCETYYFNHIITYDEGIGRFRELENNELMPSIDKLSFFQNPAIIEGNFSLENIQLIYDVPRFGTVMKVRPYIDECGVEDDGILSAISNFIIKEFKWNCTKIKFEEVP